MSEIPNYLNVDENEVKQINIDDKEFADAQFNLDMATSDIDWQEGFKKLTNEIKTAVNSFNSHEINSLKEGELKSYLTTKVDELNTLIHGYLTSDEIGKEDVLKKLQEISNSKVNQVAKRIIKSRPKPLFTRLIKAVFSDTVQTGTDNINEGKKKW